MNAVVLKDYKLCKDKYIYSREFNHIMIKTIPKDPEIKTES